MQLGQLRRTVHGLTDTAVNQFLREFGGLWPTPDDEHEITSQPLLVALWFYRYLQIMHILDAYLAIELVRRIWPALNALDDKITAPENYDKVSVRLADRRYLMLGGAAVFVDLESGREYTSMPVHFVEKQIFDLSAFLTRRSKPDGAV